MLHSQSTSALDFDAQYSEIRQIFLSYYPNRLRTIFKTQEAPRWVTLNKQTNLPDQLILDAVSDRPGSFRGLRWGEKTKFAVLDIDKNSPYHNLKELSQILHVLAQVGLRDTKLYRSSMSNGWHLYIPISNDALSLEVSNLLKSYLKASGYSIKSGELEIFPSRNGLRLPLQHGFAWLNEQTGSVLMTREELTTDEAICVFVNDIEDSTNDWEVTKLRIKEELEKSSSGSEIQEYSEHSDRVSTEGFDQLYSNNIIQENYEKGRIYWQHGLHQGNEIHEAIICIGHYLWFGDENISLPAYPGTWNDKTRKRLIKQWLENNHQGLSNTINSGAWDVLEENIERAVEWRGHERNDRPSYPLTERVRERLTHLSRKTKRLWHIDDLKYANEEREKEAREKIKEAVHELSVEGKRISGRAIAKITGCSRNTVRKHSDLWLQSGSCVYNSGGIKDLDCSSKENTSSLKPSGPENFESPRFSENSEISSPSEIPENETSFPGDDSENEDQEEVEKISMMKEEPSAQKIIVSLFEYVRLRDKERGPP